MHPLLAVAGAASVGLALVDMLWTTVAVSAGGGPVTSALSHRLWRVVCAAARRADEPHRFLRLAGVAVVVSVFTVWIGLVVLGWWLVFSSSPGAVLDATTGRPVGWTARLYYAGFTASTLGVGDLVAGDGLWRVLTVVSAFSGLAVVTMSITYLVPVAGAVVDRRTLALTITSMGRSPQDLLVAAWRGGGWRALEARFQTLAPQLGTLGQRHLAYPVLHYFHDVERSVATAVAVALLDESLTILRFGVAPDARAHGLVVDSTRTSVASFLSTLSVGHIAPTEEAPPAPFLQPLRDAGIPTVDDDEFAAAVADLEERRRLLRGFVRDDGWTWDAIRPDVDEDGDDRGDGVDDRGDDASPRDVEDSEDGSDGA
jgi:hypothetical protein